MSSPRPQPSPTEGKSPESSILDLSLSEKRRESNDSRAPLADREALDPASSFGAALLVWFRIRKPNQLLSLDSIATQPSVYDGDLASFYQPRQDWEGIGAFDPSFRWTWREEKKAVQKIDYKVFLWIVVAFFALDIDRYNMTNAQADNFLSDLKMTKDDYNLGNTLSRLGFLVAELPSQLVSKRLGPDRWIPIQCCIFSIISASQFFLSGRGSFLATRFLIAFFQGGFLPDVILYLSYYYDKKSLPIRLGFLWAMNYFASMCTGFLAVGLLQMRGILGKAGWRWMFLIEGLFTLLVAIATFFMMPASPSQSKTWFRPNGYFTDREVKIIVNRAIRDDPAKGGMHNRQPLGVKTIIKCLGNYHMYPIYLIGLTFGLAGYPVSLYLTLSLKNLGFSTVNVNLLTVPNTVLSIINLLVITVISELVNNRAFVCMAENLWMFPCYLALVLIPTPGAWQYFAIATVLLGFPYVHAIQVSWASRNSGSVQDRTVSASVYNMMVQASGMIGANIYQAADGPTYPKANKAMLGVIAMNVLIVYPFAYFYYKHQNKKHSSKWDAMTKEEQAHYLATTKDEGNRRLDFQFAY